MVICTRTELGATKPTRDGCAWVHYPKAGTIKPVDVSTLPQRQYLDTETLTNIWAEALGHLLNDDLRKLATHLGLTSAALKAMDIGWMPSIRREPHVWPGWVFPMRDAAGTIIGLKVRDKTTGEKKTVGGSREGLFLQSGLWEVSDLKGETLLITEGPTDCAAALDLNFRFVAARPSAHAGVQHLIDLVRKLRRPPVVIVSDRDKDPRRGQAGAKQLGHVLAAYASSVKVILPPEEVKDLREWLKQGATKIDLNLAIQQAATIRR
jgi:hypothetical protein